MSLKRPLIGLTPGYDYDKNMSYVKNGYWEAVQKAGGIPVLLTLFPEYEDVLDEMLERCDGILATGGPDLDAKYYNEINLNFNQEISPIRDSLEMYIIKKAIACNKPVLGICRGAQVINVAFGGSLYQDINSQVKGRDLIKHCQNAPKWYPTHNVFIAAGTKVWNCFNESSIAVNSFHHQAIKDVAPGLIASSQADDGIIESIESLNHKFVVGVQWHPELMWKENPVFLKLFEAFIASASELSLH